MRHTAGVVQPLGIHVRPSAPTPPSWAARSVAEDGAVTHELVSQRRPTVRLWCPQGCVQVPTEVSVSATDLSVDGGWVRSRPTVQIEGGTYSLDAVRELRSAIDGLLSSLDDPGDL